jgi:hypothetical protein
VEEKTIGTEIVLDAYDWRAHMWCTETQEDKTMVKLIETQVLWGTTYRKRYYMDGKRVSEAEWMDTFNNVYKTPDDVANARCDVKKTGSHKVRYTWCA